VEYVFDAGADPCDFHCQFGDAAGPIREDNIEFNETTIDGQATLNSTA
jgi:hypothetical protein